MAINYIHNKIGIRERVILDAAARQAKSASDASSIAFVIMAENGTIDEVTASEHSDIFAPWEPDVAYTVGALRTYDEEGVVKLYKCIQAHTSQADWTPPATPALWSKAGDPTVEFPEWSQPIGAADAYQVGDKVHHIDSNWVSNTPNNVWEPGVYGWDVVVSE